MSQTEQDAHEAAMKYYLILNQYISLFRQFERVVDDIAACILGRELAPFLDTRRASLQGLRTMLDSDHGNARRVAAKEYQWGIRAKLGDHICALSTRLAKAARVLYNSLSDYNRVDFRQYGTSVRFESQIGRVSLEADSLEREAARLIFLIEQDASSDEDAEAEAEAQAEEDVNGDDEEIGGDEDGCDTRDGSD